MPNALHIYQALFGFLHGHVPNELQESTVNPDETDDLLRLGLHWLPLTGGCHRPDRGAPGRVAALEAD